MRRVSAAVYVAVLLATLYGASCIQICDPANVCDFTYKDKASGTYYDFNFAGLCNSQQSYHFQDVSGHDYYANICGMALENCLPETWTNKLEYGVAIQMWGDTPDCQTKNCKHKNGDDACCTRDCQVLGSGDPVYTVNDPRNPGKGGVRAAFKTAPPADDDPFFCPWDPKTGQQLPREVHYVFQCNPSENGAKPVDAEQNSTDDCRYTLYFDTNRACASGGYNPSGNGGGGGGGGGMNAGVVILIVLIVGIVLYIGIGMTVTYLREGIIAFPNRHFWSASWRKTKSLCQRGSSTGGSGGFQSVGGAAGAVSGSATNPTAYQSDTVDL